MKLDSYKELRTVFYDETSVKILHFGPYIKGRICFGAHWHSRIEIIRVIKGSLNVLIKDERRILKGGDMAIACPCQLHAGIADEDNTEYDVIMFEVEEFINSTALSKNTLAPIADSTVIFDPFTSDSDIITVADDIVTFQSSDTDIHALRIHGKILELLGLLYERCNPKRKTPSSSDEKFNAVIEYVNEHYTEKITTISLSRQFGYEEAYFCRRFKKITGITAMKYINILRLEKAQHLLKKQEDEIAMIAARCGFSDTSYFAQSFHTHYGMSPTEFRRKSTKKIKE